MHYFKTLSIILSIILFQSLNAQIAEKKEKNDYNVVSFLVENDYGFSDRYYTNGLKLSYTTSGDDFYTSYLQFKFLELFINTDDRQAYQSISGGQNMYVSSDISEVNPSLDDHPYSGLLYFSFGSHYATKDTLHSFTITLGVTGSASLADRTQIFYHDLMGFDEPMGWDTQISNEFGFAFSYEYVKRTFSATLSENLSVDILSSVGCDLGNIITQGTASSIIRIGYNLPYSFKANRINYADNNDVQYLVDDMADWHLFLYTGLVGRFVGYDIALNGNTYQNSRSVDNEWLVGEFLAGISTRYNNFQLDFNYTMRSKEYTTQEHDIHIFCTVALKYYF